MRTALATTLFVVALVGARAEDKPEPLRPLRDLLTDLKNTKDKDSWEIRAKAADGIAAWGYKAREEEDEDKQKAALADLKKQTGAALLVALKDADEDVREAAAAAAGAVGLDDKEAVKLILDLLKLKEQDTRETVAVALGQIGRMGWEDHPGIPALLPMLSADKSEVREAAAEALAELGPLPTSAVKPLVGVLKDTNKTVRAHAARALGDIGPDVKKNREAVPALIEALQDKVRLNDADAQREHRRSRASAAEALGLIEAKAQPAVQALADIVSSKSEPYMVRQAAADALGLISAHSGIAVPALLEVVKDKPEKGQKAKAALRVAAARALGEFFSDPNKRGAQYKDAHAALEEIVNDKGFPGLKKAAKEALEKMDNAKK